MNAQTAAEIIDHARREFPRESCGLIVNVEGKERYFPCRNIAENQTDFILDPADYIRCEDAGQILAVAHSHCNVPARPTQADLVGCEASGLPWHIVSLPTETWEYIEPKGYKAPLIGRDYCLGVLDCYSLIRDWYAQERGIELPDYERSEEWWKKGQNLYMDNFRAAGFDPVEDDLAVGDIILMQLNSSVPNHAAVYIGNGQMIHHPQKRLSCRAVYGGFYQKCTRLVIRYQKK